ncbi:endonuclease III [Aggregicoccus sp. 17bor-14]|uniref:endonuclease III n=1 Tax=Myxococcaceae TaxID=31 RepID=UPI003519ECE2
MARESRAARAERAQRILTLLGEAMPDARIELDHRSPYELLVAVILSAQCTDRRVNMVTPALFRRFPDARSLAQADEAEVRPFIQSLGLYRAKAKNLVAAARQLVAEHGGEVPVRRAPLALLPGVGNKTAGVVSMHIGGDVAFPVDTHVKRLAQRMDLTREEAPDKVERDLQALLPPERWVLGHQLLVWHGRRTCFARAPACERCPVRALCPRRGVEKA